MNHDNYGKIFSKNEKRAVLDQMKQEFGITHEIVRFEYSPKKILFNYIDSVSVFDWKGLWNGIPALTNIEFVIIGFLYAGSIEELDDLRPEIAESRTCKLCKRIVSGKEFKNVVFIRLVLLEIHQDISEYLLDFIVKNIERV